MTSRPLSSFIPSNWTQQQKRPASIHSQSSQKSISKISTSWSLDQLSYYARKSSINLLSNNNEQDKKKKKQTDKIQSSKITLFF